MRRRLAAILAGLTMLLAPGAQALADDISPETMAEIEKADEAYRAHEQELRVQHADEIRAHDQAVRDWRDANPPPEGTTYSSIHTSYDEDFLPEGTEVTNFNRWNIPTHTTEFGPDAEPIDPFTQTQQGRAFETFGPHIPPGGGFQPRLGEDFEGNEIITHVDVYDEHGQIFLRYDFNFEGVPWRGERFDPDTGRRVGAFQDDRLRPPEDTLGGPLDVPAQVRFLTGVCDKCRPLMEKQNELARQINWRIIEMQSLSEQHQQAFAAAQRPIRARHEYLKGDLAALMPQFEAAQAEAIACDRGCRPSEENDNFAVNDPSGEPAPTPPAGPGGPQLDDTAIDAITPTADAYPANNADLQQAMAAVQAYLAAANCDGMECPTCDCAQAREAVQALYDLERYLTEMLPYLQAAQADHLKLLQSQIETSSLNADQQARTIEAIGLHQALHNFGSMLLDIASVMSWAKEIATSDKALDELSPAELLDRLDGLYEAMKDLESGINTAAEVESGQEQSSPIGDLVELAPGVDKDFINDTTSTISDVKSIVQAAVENGKDWRKALKDGGALAALGQIGGRYLKGFSADKLKERQRALADLERDAGAVGIAQTAAYNEWRKAGDRRWLAEDLLVAVREAQQAYGGCVYRVCGPFTMTRPVIPSFMHDVPGGKPQLSWGKALRWFNGAIAHTLPRLKPVPFVDDCPPDEDPRTQPDKPANAIGSAPLPPEATRPPLTPLDDPVLPASFCSEFERVDFLNNVYNPAAATALANSQTSQAHVAQLNELFTHYMRNEGGPVWAAIQREMADYKLVSEDAFAQSNRINALYADILAVPIVPCPETADNDNAIPSTGEPVTPVKDSPEPGDKPAKPDCPPEERREPITVGPNSKVGSGARFKAKAASTALGIAGGLLGGGGGGSPFGGGGGGGSSGPPTVRCKITDSEMTVFDDPLTGVSLKVGAKRAGDKVVIFADIAKSPDNGTFQTAFMENPQGDTLAPSDVNICDLWGEWKLTVSWTKSTYVDGQLVSRETGGWSKGGLFRIPGVLSSSDAPDGLWKRLGFSNASHGARKIAMTYNLPKAQTAKGPLVLIIHVTRPGEDPVTTVPFAMQLVEGPNGFTLTKAPKEDCPPEVIPAGAATAAPSEGPVRSPLSLGPAQPGEGPQPVDNLYLLEQLIDVRRKADMDKVETLTNWSCPVNEDIWKSSRHDWIDNLEDWRSELNRMTPTGLVADGVREAIDGEKARVSKLIDEWGSRDPPRCPAAEPTPEEEPEDSILDEVEPTLVPA